MFIPIGDDNSRRSTFPFVVLALIGANALVWYLQLTLGERFTAGFSAVPLEITRGIDLLTPQAVIIEGHRITIPQARGPDPIYLTLLSSMFMHGSWMHIIGNMVYLFIFGDQIEDELGHFKFLVFYLLSGFAAAAAQIGAEPNSIIPCVGASGAIAGVLGAYLILHPKNQVRVLVFQSMMHVPAIIVLVMWGVMQFFGQLTALIGHHTGVAYMAHLGGFVVGLAVACFMRAAKWRRSRIQLPRDR